ncbi:MAG: type I CRISPR-associated protein Cas7 [Sedimentisphaerales bacterium]|nr:type I CRISPR-associated protein Cas7 [Sedimentisphaerales bacterium]
MSDSANNKIMRGTGLLIIEVRNSNPNGDPDRESDPRQRPDKRGEISPVSFKAKLRSLVENKEGPVWLAVKNKFDLKQEQFEILESRQRQKSEINEDEETFKNKFWDGRLFGNTELEKGREVPVKTGVAQFGMGISVSPIEIGRYTTTNPPVEVGKTAGMAPLAYRVVHHAVYSMPFFINPTAATKSGCTRQDIDVMLWLIPWAYSHTRSYMRPFVEIRHAWYMEHNSPLGSCSDFALIDAMKPTRKNGFNSEKPSKSWDEYYVPPKLSDELANRIKPLRDLMDEAAGTIST